MSEGNFGKHKSVADTSALRHIVCKNCCNHIIKLPICKH